MGALRLKSKRLIDGTPKGIRTPVTAVKGRCPRPLDDGSTKTYKLRQDGGAKRDRTADLYTASVALSQLSYSPSRCLNRVAVCLNCGAHSMHSLYFRQPLFKEKYPSLGCLVIFFT